MQRYDLRRFSWHTGAQLTRVDPHAQQKLLFRDLGLAPMLEFLRGRLTRLAGPMTPLMYFRSCDYIDPYTDYAGTGRIVFLDPLKLDPWHAGVPEVFVSRAQNSQLTTELKQVIAYLPGDADQHLLSERAPTNKQELREELGNHRYDEQLEEAQQQLADLVLAESECERLAEPLRRVLQRGDGQAQRRATELMQHLGIDDHDLSAAWHHVPSERRQLLKEGLERAEQDGYWQQLLAGGR